MATNVNVPTLDDELSQEREQTAPDWTRRAISIEIDDCLDGLPEEMGGGDITPTDFRYAVAVVFENQEKYDEFMQKPDSEQKEITNTIKSYMRAAGNVPINRELLRDEANPAEANPNEFNDQTLGLMNTYIAPDLVDIMNASYPDLGLDDAGVYKDTLQGVCAGPDNMAELDGTIPSYTDTSATSFTM